jgi:hypothetical protein
MKSSLTPPHPLSLTKALAACTTLLLVFAVVSVLLTFMVTHDQIEQLQGDLVSLRCDELSGPLVAEQESAIDYTQRAARCNHTANQSLPFAMWLKRFVSYIGFFLGFGFLASLVVAVRIYRSDT